MLSSPASGGPPVGNGLPVCSEKRVQKAKPTIPQGGGGWGVKGGSPLAEFEAEPRRAVGPLYCPVVFPEGAKVDQRLPSPLSPTVKVTLKRAGRTETGRKSARPKQAKGAQASRRRAGRSPKAIHLALCEARRVEASDVGKGEACSRSMLGRSPVHPQCRVVLDPGEAGSLQAVGAQGEARSLSTLRFARREGWKRRT